MLRALTTTTRDQVLVEGDGNGFAALATLIRAGTGHLAVDRCPDPSPYADAMAYIVVQAASSGAVEISCSADGRELRIVRPHAQADLLAQNLGDYPASLEADTHVHLEHYPDHPYLSETSVPMVVGLTAG